MKKLIVFDSMKGFTKECAEFLHDELVDSSMISLNELNDELLEYEEIYLGTYIIKGAISSDTRKFLKKNHTMLLNKKLKLFISALDKSDYEHALQTSLHPEIYYRTKKVNSGGRIIYNELTFLEKRSIKRFTDLKEDILEFNKDRLLELIKE